MIEDFKAELNRKNINFDQLGKHKFKINTLPNDFVTDEEIEEFFEKLVFAVNQPKEAELGKIIEAILGKDIQFNSDDSELIASQFQKEMLDWMRENEEHFLTYEDGKAFLNEANQKLSKIVSIGNYDKELPELK